MATPEARSADQNPEELESVVIRFAGDSGDGMQLTGTQFTNTSAIHGNDLSTLPDYPAEIRAPAGTLAGVSGFQLNFAATEIFTPGDSFDVLVAMNPAALKRNLADVKDRGTIIANTGGFSKKNLKMAGYAENPLEDGSLDGYRLISLDVSALVAEALKESGLSSREIERSKNFFVLGILYWTFSRSMEPTLDWIRAKFKGKDQLIDANIQALKQGHAYGETTEVFQDRYEVKPRTGATPGQYMNLTGNRAVALGFVVGAKKAGLPLFLGSYPITPASDILHELSRLKQYDVATFQAEDEIAAVCATIGAAFGGAVAITSTSGPGVALKAEAMGLACITELPIIVINVQRGGPSTGLPTKTEQSDLLQAMYGRNGESPMALIAARTPADCFDTAIEAVRIATKYMMPVMLMSDGYLANGAEPWRIPNLDDIEDFKVEFRKDAEGYEPYMRDENLARPWARPGTPGLEHRIGGLEKEHIYGGVSYDPDNHEFMTHLRQSRVDKIADDIPDAEINGESKGDLLLVGWGSTYGALTAGVEKAQAEGKKVSHLHLWHVNPLPKNLGPVMEGFSKVVVPEMNNGQLVKILRGVFAMDKIVGLNKIKGQPFKTSEITAAIDEHLS